MASRSRSALSFKYTSAARPLAALLALALAAPLAGCGTTRVKVVETKVRFKRLSNIELKSYLASGEWRGKAGGYAVQGIAGAFVVKLVGSYTNVVGLPLTETTALLGGEGYPIRDGWLDAG